MSSLQELGHFLRFKIDKDEEPIEDKQKVYDNLVKLFEKKGYSKAVARMKATEDFAICGFKRW